MGLGPFDLTGGPFLALYAGLFVLAVVAELVIPRWLRPEGRPTMVNDADSLAVLAGGPTRFGEALLARLLASRAVTVEGGSRVLINSRGGGRTSAERSVLALPSPTDWSQVTREIKLDAEAIEQKLVAQGLLIDAATAWQLRFWQSTPYLALAAFGAVKWEVGTLRDRPVGFLTAFLVATVICAAVRFARVDRRTRGGMAALWSARRQSDRLRRAPLAEESGLAVALFGTGVLAGGPLYGLHQLRSSAGGSSGSDSSSSCSSSGCGGGGCGGCGS